MNVKAYDKCTQNAIALYEDAETHGIAFDKEVQDTVSKARFISIALSLFAIVAGVVICAVYYKEIKAAN